MVPIPIPIPPLAVHVFITTIVGPPVINEVIGYNPYKYSRLIPGTWIIQGLFSPYKKKGPHFTRDVFLRMLLEVDRYPLVIWCYLAYPPGRRRGTLPLGPAGRTDGFPRAKNGEWNKTMEKAWKMHGKNGDVTNDSYTLPKFNSSPLKSYLPNREVVF